MTVATLRLVLRISPCPHPREKRRRTQAIMDKLHRSFNVSVAAFDQDDDPAEATLAVVAVARTRREAHALLARVVQAVAAEPRVALLSHEIHEV